MGKEKNPNREVIGDKSVGIDQELKIHANTKPYDKFKLYTRKNFTFLPGLNNLVGCNGSGKTTLLDIYLLPYLRENKIPYIRWNDRRYGGSNLMDKMLNFDNDMDGLVAMALSSEGEQISYGLISVFKDIGRSFRQYKDQAVVILLDAIDSGMSVDEIIEIRSCILDVVIPDAQSQGATPYFILATNNYEWCNDDRINNINISNGQRLFIHSYEEYKDIILNSRELKNKLRGYTDE